MPIAGSPSGRDWGGVGLVSGHNLCVAKSALKVEPGVYAFKRVTFHLLLICRGKPGPYKSNLQLIIVVALRRLKEAPSKERFSLPQLE
jgi:hypothetical protein